MAEKESKVEATMEETKEVVEATVSSEEIVVEPEIKQEKVDVKEVEKDEPYFKQLGLTHQFKPLDSSQAKKFNIDKSGFLGVVTYKQFSLKYRLKNDKMSIDSICETNNIIIDNIHKIIKANRLQDVEIKRYDYPKLLYVNEDYIFLNLLIPYTTKSRVVIKLIHNVLANHTVKGSIEYGRHTTDVLKIHINEDKECNEEVFAKGFAVISYNHYLAAKVNNVEPNIIGGTFIDSTCGFDFSDIRNMNRGLLVKNKINLYNDVKREEKGYVYTIPFTNRIGLISYQIDSMNTKNEYQVTRTIVRSGISTRNVRKEDKYEFKISSYSFDHKTDVIMVKNINEIFEGKNGEFILSNLIDAPSDGVEVNIFRTDIDSIDDSIFKNMTLREPEVEVEE